MRSSGHRRYCSLPGCYSPAPTFLAGSPSFSIIRVRLPEQAHFGLTQPALWAAMTIAVEVAGSLMVLFDRLTWLGAGMLGVFTILAAFVANDFWTMQGAERFAATNAFFEHLGLAGAFVLVAALSLANRNGPASRDRSKTG